MERMSVTLPAEMARFICDSVEEGRYASSSELIREAMDAWREKEQLRLQRHDAVRVTIAQADLDSPPSLTEAEVYRDLEDRVEQSLATQDWRTALIEKRLLTAEAGGETVDHDDVERGLDSRGTLEELPIPRARPR
jgi:antitoxin ParD1/3/4